MSDWLDASHGCTEQYMYKVTLSPDNSSMLNLYLKNLLLTLLYPIGLANLI
jgi:hypothetical protein